jgi:zinc protease
MKIQSIIYTLTISLIALILGCSPKVGNDLTKKTKDKISEQVDTVAPALLIKKRDFAINEALPKDPNVKVGQLPNGMKYFIRKNNKPENRAELRLAVNVGSMQETEAQRGLAHFVEHMAFNGTKHFKKNELVNYLESIGTKFGPDLNAYTSFDETVYMLQIPTDDEMILAKGLLIMRDWASDITFDPAEVDKERGVVLSEWRTGLGSSERMRNQWFPIVFNGSRYAERLPIGKPEIIQNASYQTIKDYYKRWYRPDLMALSIVGDFDVDEMERKIIDEFSTIEKPTTPANRTFYEVPNNKEMLVAIASDKEATSTSIQIMYKKKHQPIKTVGDYKMKLLAELYNGMLNQRLDELSREKDPAYVYAYSDYSSLVRTKDAYFSYVLVPDNGIEIGLKALIGENQRIRQHGFTKTELERQKATFLNTLKNAYNEKDKTPSNRHVMNYIYHFLENQPMMGIEYMIMITEQYLPTIKLEEVNGIGSKWITDENRAVVVTMPKKDGIDIPTEQEILRWMTEASQQRVEPYQEEEPIGALMSRPKTTNKFYGTKEHKEVGVTELSFPNGIKIILKPTDFKNDEILLSAFRKGGTSLNEDADVLNAVLSDNVVTQSGFSEFDAIQIEKYLSSKTVAVYPYISELEEGFSGYSSIKDLEVLFQLIYLYHTSPRLDKAAAKSLLSKQISQTRNQTSSPNYHFYRELNNTLYKNHPRRAMRTAEDYAKVDIEKAYSIFKERFKIANDFTYVFVGSFDMETIKPLIEHYIGSIPRDVKSEEKANWKDRKIEKATGKIEKTVRKGQEPKSNVALVFHGDFEHTALNAYSFNSMVKVLRIMLRESMREDKGGVYGVSVSPSLSREPDTTYSVTVSFTCDPKDVEELTQMVWKAVKKLQTKGASSANIQKIQETQRRDFEQNIKRNGFWMSQIKSAYRYETPMTGMLDYVEELVDYLDGNDIKIMANQCFDTNNYIRVVLKPEE